MAAWTRWVQKASGEPLTQMGRKKPSNDHQGLEEGGMSEWIRWVQKAGGSPLIQKGKKNHQMIIKALRK
jgi:hypothetical protein